MFPPNYLSVSLLYNARILAYPIETSMATLATYLMDLDFATHYYDDCMFRINQIMLTVHVFDTLARYLIWDCIAEFHL